MNYFRLVLITLLFSLTACNQSGVRNSELTTGAVANQATQANLSLAIEYMKLGDYEKSLEKLNRAREADPDYPGTYNVYGLLYQQIGRNKDAEKSFKKALKLYPNDSETLNNYGRFLCQQRRAEEAEKTFLTAAKNPLYATPELAITNAGTCAFSNNRLDAAESYFRRALEIDKEMPRALLQMSQLSFRQNKFLSARAYLQRYLAVARHTATSLWLGIRIEKEMGDNDALSSYMLSLKNNFPDSKEAAEMAKLQR